MGFRKQRSISTTCNPTFCSDLSLRSHLFPAISCDNISADQEFQKLEHQVAGHQFVKGKATIGLLKCKNGTILKPVIKAEVGAREINFYEQLQKTADSTLLELKEYTSDFFGTRIISIDGKNVEFIILENLLKGISEPCVIDIKIGKQTWDPFASKEKIENEQKKYALCKRDVSFCIPGFQVHKLATGKLHKYTKEYGKKLDGHTVIQALKIFLNSDANGNINRELLTQLLTTLWKIQKWAKSQRTVKLYSTSLLMIYDLKVLKTLNLEKSNTVILPQQRPVLLRKISFNSPESYSGDVVSSFSGQITRTGPILNPTTPKPLQAFSSPRASSVSSWYKTFHRMLKTYSSYGDFLVKINQDYTATLEKLNEDKATSKARWCVVKIIDFAHVYPSTDQSADTNFIEGIDSVVNILENFLYTPR